MPSMMMLMAEGDMASVMRQRADRGLEALAAHLADGRSWLAGEQFTIADIMMVFPLTTMLEFVPVGLSPYPAILAYLPRIAARPAFRRAMAKAEPDLQTKQALKIP